MTSAVVVWMGAPSVANFETATRNGVWGFAEPKHHLAALQPGDLVVFGSGFSGGSPRVDSEQWHEGALRLVAVGQVLTPVYEDHSPVWPDDVYPYRFRWQMIGQARDLPIADDRLPEPVRESLRPVGSGGTVRLATLSDIEVTRLLELVDGERPALPDDLPSASTAQSVEENDLDATDPAMVDDAPSGVSASTNVWWVNQGATFKTAMAGGYVWAPQRNKQGRPLAHWTSLTNLVPGDVVLHYANTAIRAIGRVLSTGVAAPRPNDGASADWERQGYLAQVKYFPLKQPIPISEIRGRTPAAGPFDVNGGVQQRYLDPVTRAFADQLRADFADRWPSDSPWGDAPPTMPAQPHQQPHPRPPFDAALVRSEAEIRRLQLDDEIYRTVVAAIRAGKHVVFTGPPGTAKTSLAEAVACAAQRAGLCNGHVLTTATSDWTTFETVGGLRPQADGLVFTAGQFVRAIHDNEWLIVDEMNRSNFDRAFGQLFTLLSGQSVSLPYEDAKTGRPIRLANEGTPAATDPRSAVTVLRDDWRLIATMNVFDKSLLFEMSFALMRRFAFIEVNAPADDVYRKIVATELQDADPTHVARIDALLDTLLALRDIKELGPALFLDMARFANERLAIGDIDDNRLLYQLFYSYLLPQFEGIDDTTGETLYRRLSTAVTPALRAKLRADLQQVLGVELRPVAPSPGQSASESIDTDFDEDTDAEADESAQVS